MSKTPEQRARLKALEALWRPGIATEPPCGTCGHPRPPGPGVRETEACAARLTRRLDAMAAAAPDPAHAPAAYALVLGTGLVRCTGCGRPDAEATRRQMHAAWP